MSVLNKENLIKIGYSPSTAKRIIRQAKEIMVKKGYTSYSNKKLGIVPKSVVEDILGVSFDDKNIERSTI